MERHLAGCPGLKEISYVEFWATSDTYSNAWKVKVDKFFQQLKYPIPR
jgi:hypothetical protein